MTRKRVWVTCQTYIEFSGMRDIRFWARKPVRHRGQGKHTTYCQPSAPRNQNMDKPRKQTWGECVVPWTVERLLVGLNLRPGQCKEVKLVEVKEAK